MSPGNLELQLVLFGSKASFIFCGPTGVGKTELCKAWAQGLRLIREHQILNEMETLGPFRGPSRVINVDILSLGKCYGFRIARFRISS